MVNKKSTHKFWISLIHLDVRMSKRVATTGPFPGRNGTVSEKEKSYIIQNLEKQKNV